MRQFPVDFQEFIAVLALEALLYPRKVLWVHFVFVEALEGSLCLMFSIRSNRSVPISTLGSRKYVISQQVLFAAVLFKQVQSGMWLTLWNASLGMILSLIIQLTSCTCSSISFTTSTTHAWTRFPSHSMCPCWQSKLSDPSLFVVVCKRSMESKWFFAFDLTSATHRCLSVGHQSDVHVGACPFKSWQELSIYKVFRVRTEGLVEYCD